MKKGIIAGFLAFLLICPVYSETLEPLLESPVSTSETTFIGGHILFIIPQYNFIDDEYSIPKVILSRAGYTVEVASSSTREVALGADILKVRPNLTIDQINVDQYDALIMVGGYLSKKFYENQALIDKVKEFNSKGKLIGAMDNMPYYLALWGLLKDVKVTVHPSLAKNLIKMGINYIEKDIVIDKNFITVNTYKYSDAFGNEIVEALKKR